jgi:hypothetical protein
VRLGLPQDGIIRKEHLALQQTIEAEDSIGTTEVHWQSKGKKMFYTLLHMVPFHVRQQVVSALEREVYRARLPAQVQPYPLDEDSVLQLFERVVTDLEIDIPLMRAQIVREKG